MSSITRAAVASACLVLPLTLSACGSQSKSAGSAPSSTSSSAAPTSSSSSPASSPSSAASSPAASGSGSAAGGAAGSTPSNSAAGAPNTSAGGAATSGGTSGSASAAPSAKGGEGAKASAPTAPAAAGGYKKVAPVATSAPHSSAPKSSAGPAPTGKQSLATKVSGRTLSYSYSSYGSQTMFQSYDGTVMAYNKPAKMTISFGDGTTDAGAEAGMGCKPNSAVHPFTASASGQHVYTHAGTYKVTVRTEFCGARGLTSTTSTYNVTIR